MWIDLMYGLLTGRADCAPGHEILLGKVLRIIFDLSFPLLSYLSPHVSSLRRNPKLCNRGQKVGDDSCRPIFDLQPRRDRVRLDPRQRFLRDLLDLLLLLWGPHARGELSGGISLQWAVQGPRQRGQKDGGRTTS